MPRRQSPKRIRQLLAEHPYLRVLHDPEARTAEQLGYEYVPDIRIQRGDPNLMYRQADIVSGVGSSLADIDNRTIMGAQDEFFYPVNYDGRLGLAHFKYNRELYVRNMFMSKIGDWGTPANPFEAVESIVWVTRETWYPQGSDLSGHSGNVRPVRRNVWFTVYQQPRQGWRELYWTADPMVNVKLYGWKLLPGPATPDSVRMRIVNHLGQLAQEFQHRVWATGLGRTIDASRKKGMSGQFGSVKVMSYIICGRLRIQFDRGNASLTLGGNEDVDNPNLGFASITGTVPQAEKLVRDVIRFWEQADAETRRTVHQDNERVNMGF